MTPSISKLKLFLKIKRTCFQTWIFHFLTYAGDFGPWRSEGSLACRTYCDTGHLFIVTPIAERLTVELSPPVLTNWVCRGWDSNTQPSASGANALTNCATAAGRCILHHGHLARKIHLVSKMSFIFLSAFV